MEINKFWHSRHTVAPGDKEKSVETCNSFSYFSIKTVHCGISQNHFSEVILMTGCRNLLFNGSVQKIHTCDIFLGPDREIWDFSEGDWGLR